MVPSIAASPSPRPGLTRRARTILRATFLALAWASGCAIPEVEAPSSLPFPPASPAHAPDPGAPGPYAVGVRTVSLVDVSRQEPDGEPRTLVTEIWYPAKPVDGGDPQAYDLWAYLPEDLRNAGAPGAFGTLETDAIADAPLADEGGPFPAVVFSHGNGGVRMQSAFFTARLASHGYVVLAPDHAGNTLVELIRAGGALPESAMTRAFLERPIDVSFLLDAIAALPHDDPLADAIDLDRVGIAGHSFGALTAFRAASFDGRIGAALGMAPVGRALVELGLSTPLADLGIPSALHVASRDRTLPVDEHADTLWDALAAPRERLTLRTAGHFSFSHMCDLDLDAVDAAFDVRTGQAIADGCGPENLEPAVAFRVVDHFGVGFFNLHLRRSPKTAAFLTDAAARDLAGADEASFEAER